MTHKVLVDDLLTRNYNDDSLNFIRGSIITEKSPFIHWFSVPFSAALLSSSEETSFGASVAAILSLFDLVYCCDETPAVLPDIMA